MKSYPHFYFFAVTAALLIMACSKPSNSTPYMESNQTAAIKNAPPSFQNKNQNMKLSYIDGNNNAYRITSDSIIYDPVQAHESSSGMYSGGEPVQKRIRDIDFSMIKKKMEEVLADKSQHLTDRPKGSPIVIVEENGSEKKCAISIKSSARKELEIMLKEAIH